MSVCCIGQSAYDITVRIDEQLVPDRKYRVESHVECPGGPALNAACVCSKWGEPTSLVSRVGDDQYGSMILESLQRYGVGVGGMIRDPVGRTSLSFIIANGLSGERTIFNIPPVHGSIGAVVPEETPTVILSDGHEPEASNAFMDAFPTAIRVVDAGSCRSDVLAVVSRSEYVVCSQAFAEQYLGRPLTFDAESLRESLLSIGHINEGCKVIVTLGGEGLAFLEGDRLEMMPAFKADAVDTTGAGDIFHGAFVFGLARNLNMRKCLTLASMAAAVSVTRCGGQISIPTLGEVTSRLGASWTEVGSGVGRE